MEIFLLRLLSCFLMSAAFGILCRIPQSALLWSGAGGALCWAVMYAVSQAGGKLVAAVSFGSLALGLAAEWLARRTHKPATIYIVTGFIPLVPGAEAYHTMRLLVEGTYAEAGSMAVRMLLIAGAIAFGLFLSSALIRMLRRSGKGAGKHAAV